MILIFISNFFIYSIRNNPMKSVEVIEPLANLVSKKFPVIKVDLSNPEVSLVVEILKKTCCLGVVTEHSARAKYNLVEMAQKQNK